MDSKCVGDLPFARVGMFVSSSETVLVRVSTIDDGEPRNRSVLSKPAGARSRTIWSFWRPVKLDIF